MGTQQNFEWRFCDEDGADDQRWASIQAATPDAETEPGWQWRSLRKLWVTLPFIALLFWSRPWQSREAIRQPDEMPTL